MVWWLTAFPQTEMRTLWRGIVRTVFWSYERGSRPYDVMVGVILLFVLFTPRHWFHDQPESSEFSATGVEFLSQDSSSQMAIYRVQARMLAPEKRTSKTTPELEREIHGILNRTVDQLNGQSFQVWQISPVSAPNGTVLYYDVSVHLARTVASP